jgi:hypothetical protein
MAVSFVLMESFFKRFFLNVTLEIDGAASNGGQEQLKIFVYFPYPQIEAGLSILKLCSSFTRCLGSLNLRKELSRMKH